MPMDAATVASLASFAEDAKAGLRGLDAKASMAAIEARYEDLTAALQWCIDAGRTDDALALVASLDTFWMAAKRLEEGATWFDRVLAMPGGDERLRGTAMFEAGLLVFWTGDDAGARTWHEQALEIGRATGDPTLTAQALTGIARIEARDDLDEARRLCREALAVTDGTDDRLGRGNALHVLAVCAQMQGDLLEARDLQSERIRLAREMGNIATVGYESGNLSMVERQLGNLDRAEALARDALTIYDQRDDNWAIPLGLSGLAAIAAARGETERAATLVGAAEALIAAAGMGWPPDEIVQYEGTVATLTERMGTADYERVRDAGRSLTARAAVDVALGDSGLASEAPPA
jgi:non-specific serine/threonine protein kinase